MLSDFEKSLQKRDKKKNKNRMNSPNPTTNCMLQI